MHLKSDNTDFMIYDNADEVTEDIFETLLNRDEIGLETSIRVSDFIFDCVHLFYYKYQEIKDLLYDKSQVYFY